MSTAAGRANLEDGLKTHAGPGSDPEHGFLPEPGFIAIRQLGHRPVAAYVVGMQQLQHISIFL